jgi:hypothetical protein
MRLPIVGEELELHYQIVCLKGSPQLERPLPFLKPLRSFPLKDVRHVFIYVSVVRPHVTSSAHMRGSR